MEMKRIYEEQRENGFYYAEDHGADCAGVFFIGKRCRKAKYIATAMASNIESIKRRIERHANPDPFPPPGTPILITSL